MHLKQDFVRRTLLVGLALACAWPISAEQNHFFRFETVARSLSDDGHKQLNDVRASSIDSTHGAQSFFKKWAQASRFKQASPSKSYNRVESHNYRESSTVNAGSSIYTINGRPVSVEHQKQFEESFLKSLAGHGGFRRGFLTSRSRGGDNSMHKRTVESPALSVDSGGRSSTSSRLADTISKVFHVDQGHYADIYNRIDSHQPLSTRRPAEIIDETLERALLPSKSNDNQRQRD